jgi:hypothetical protein
MTDTNGNPDKGFIADSNRVFTILQKVFGTTSVWAHVRKFEKKKDGRAAWLTLTENFFGKSKYKNLQEEIRSKVDALVYTGPRKNFTFDRYVNMYVALMAEATDLLEYSPTDEPMYNESMKIYHFTKNNQCESFRMCTELWYSNNNDHKSFDDAKAHYMDYHRRQLIRSPATLPGSDRRVAQTKSVPRPTVREVAPAGAKAPPPTQAEIDACIHIKNMKYPPEQYAKFSAAEKARKWQLFEAARLAREAKKRSVAETGTAVMAPDSDSNRSNPALARQASSPKKNKTETDE